MKAKGNTGKVIVIRRRAVGQTNYHYLVEDETSGLCHVSNHGYASERAAKLAGQIHLLTVTVKYNAKN